MMTFKMTVDGRTYLDDFEVRTVLNVAVEVNDPVEPDGKIVTLRFCVDRVEVESGFKE